jgi:hypothetical protein
LEYRGNTVHTQELTLAEGEIAQRLIRIPTGPAVSGRIIPSDGRRLEEVRFLIKCRDLPVLSEARVARLRRGGFFELLVESAKGRCSIQARAYGYMPSSPIEVEIKDRDLRNLEFHLRPGRTLQGVVLTRESTPVPSAKVQLRSTLQDANGRQFEAVGSTDSAGRFRIDGLPQGEYRVRVRAKGFVVEDQPTPIVVPEEQDILGATLWVRSGWELAGQVTDSSGKALADARIEIREASRAYRTKTSENGEFYVDGIVPDGNAGVGAAGIDVVGCEAKGFAPTELYDVAPGQGLTLRLLPGGSIDVFIDFSDGAVPKDLSWVIALEERETIRPGPSTARFRRSYTAEGKEATLTELPEGNFTVSVIAVGRETKKLEDVHVSAGRTAQVRLTLEPKSSSEPIPGAVLRITDPDKLRQELQQLLKDVPRTSREAILRSLRSICDEMPSADPSRGALDHALKALNR